MTDIDILMAYRLQQAEETLQDAATMLTGNFSSRSIVNRSYYAAFYAVLALFLSEGISIRTSKHSGIISVFNKEFILSAKIDRRFSKKLEMFFRILHRFFLRTNCLPFSQEISVLTDLVDVGFCPHKKNSLSRYSG
jgi:uncharacterized protein (UPF0332 family)